jgi:hypothetical protein
MRKEQKLEKLELVEDKELQEWEKYQQDLELAIENH